MLNKFKEHIKEQFAELLSNPILIGCSGGVDSVVLVHLCHQLGLDIALAHCNFQLRGQESDSDESFVMELAESLSVPFYTTKFDTNKYAKEHKTSIQIAARELRYQWFSKLAIETNRPYLLTAHQQDDSLESFFINASRGTGVDGLTGIPPRRTLFRRPLLPFSRASILAFAKDNSIQWREDQSNSDTKYLRNQVRHLLIPEFEKLHPTAKQNLRKTQEHLRDTSLIVQRYMELIQSKLFQKEGELIAISIHNLLIQSPLKPIVYELFYPFGFSDVTAILSLINSMSGKKLVSETHYLLKDRDQLLLKEIQQQSNQDYLIDIDTQSIFKPLELKFEKVDTYQKANGSIIFVDQNKLKYPLKIRKAKEGDVFKPYGLNGSKKLSKFFKDEKFSRFQKEDQWILCDANDQIIWIIGYQADRSYKIDDQTNKISKITYLIR